MSRSSPEVLEGAYTVLTKSGLRANARSDPQKWALWNEIWNSNSFEELARKCPNSIQTSRTGRAITWRSEVRWALKRGWIIKSTS